MRILFALSGLSLLACVASATAAEVGKFPVCISFAPSGYCDGMEFDANTHATWHNYDCAGSQGKQTRAIYPIHTITRCDGSKGCNPAAAYGWDDLNWKFDRAASTGTLIGITGGQKEILQQDIPVSITPGACDFSRVRGGVSSLVR